MKQTVNVVRRLLAVLALGSVLGPLAQAGGAGAPPAVRPAATPAAKTATFSNPVINENVPDPFILKANGRYYAYVTNGNGADVPLYTSRDLVNWTYYGDALGGQPKWARGGLTWAPEVMQFAQNRYVLYYTTHDLLSDRQCIGAAVATRPEGPFTDRSERPIVCQAELGGSIDPSPFQDRDGTRYLLFKNDGNCCNQLTILYIQKLSPDGLKLLGEPTALLHNVALWEGSVVEAPTLHLAGGVYYLLFSGAVYNDDTYAVGYATASSLLGPYREAADNPLLYTQGPVVGPGHQSVVQDAAGHDWLVYHAWTLGAVGEANGGARSLRLDPVRFAGGKIYFHGPSVKPQPAPAARP